MLTGRLSGESAGLRMLVAGVVLGAGLVAIAVTEVRPLYPTVGFCIGIAVAVQTVSYMTLRPALTPDDLLGRVGSTAWTTSVGLRLLSQLGGGAMIAATSGGVALMGKGGLAIAACILFGLSRTFRAAGRLAG